MTGQSLIGQSLTRRAVAAVLSVELLCAVAFCCTALWHERATRLHAFDATLGGRSDSLLGAVQDAEDPEDNVAIDPAELRLPPEDAYAVYNQGGRLLGSSPGAPGTLIARAGDGLRGARSGRREYRVLQREALRIIDRAENGGVGLRRPVTIVYAAPTAQIWHEVLEAAGFYALVSFVLVSTTTVILLLLTRRLLRPIGELAAAAGGVSVRSLHFKAPESAERFVELRPLTEALSATIGRLRQAFENEQRFVGDAAHELKTAVAVVRSTVQLLGLRPRSGEEYRDGLERVLQDNERVEQLIARMLTLARYEEGAETSPNATDLTAGVRGAVDQLRGFAEAHGTSLHTSLEPGVCARVGQEAVQVLVSNLVVNAVQHSLTGGAVSVCLRTRADAGHMAFLEVKDGGAGIAAETLPHVFRRFFREDRSRSRETGGAGLGLAICKSLVENAGGQIALESVQGEGTTVRVSFRLA